jgi:transposase
MTKENLTMSHQELDRVTVIRATAVGELKQIQAAERLQLSIRHIKRLVRDYRRTGAQALLSKRRGRMPNNAIDSSIRDRAIALLREDRYQGFAPTLAHEKLIEQHGFAFSVETLRQWMMADGLWKTKQRVRARIHPSRPRRPCEGELVQIDGSPHAWFEERGPEYTLIVFIDDATSRLKALRFAPSETTKAYMETLDDYLTQHGRPVALYSDKHSIFRVNHPDCQGELTQFTRAIKTLNIEPIHANTPQAKGRVERANQTLQDRLSERIAPTWHQYH